MEGNRLVSATSATSTCQANVPPPTTVSGTGPIEVRVKKVWMNFYGGATDAAIMQIQLGTRDNGTITFRKPVINATSNAGPPNAADWDFGDGIFLPNGITGAVVAKLLTTALADAAVPTSLALQVQFEWPGA